MRRHKIILLLLGCFILLTTLSLALVTLYASREFRLAHQDGKRATLRELGGFLARYVAADRLLHPDRRAMLSDLCTAAAADFNVRITLIGPDGVVLFDTGKEAEKMGNHGSRPEVAAALRGTVGFDVHFSKEVGRQMIYCGTPVFEDKTLTGVVRTSFAVSDVQAGITHFYQAMLAVGMLAILASVLAAYLLSRRLIRPLEQMRRGAENFSHGSLSERILPSSVEEIGATIDALNHMAGELAVRINTSERERAEKERVLASMSEGVLALDADDRILYLNTAMCRIFVLQREAALRRFLHEVVRVPEIQRLVETCKDAAARGTAETDLQEPVTFAFPGEKQMQAHAVPLPVTNGATGTLLVFNDITRLSRLERTRQDFVANVSHELRTPITSILGFVETLIEGAAGHPEKAARFLGIIKTQAARMAAIIDDLLLLSRLDSGTEIPQEAVSVRQLLGSAVDACLQSAERRRIRLETSLAEEIELRGNGHLLEQALGNLISNAINYSSPETTVRIEAARQGAEAVIRVIDQGCGIATGNLSRIFERFFRVDKARSPNGGGTGLGLSIVKHIALIHNGRVEVESQLGRGSVFQLVIPLPFH